MNDTVFNWHDFASYRVFDEYLDRLLINRNSYITKHELDLDLESALSEIIERFISRFDESEQSFDEKIEKQFADASTQAKVLFANIEYLWCMPMQNITSSTKRQYLTRWFSENEIIEDSENYFFGHPDTIADPGPWYLRNKYWEIVAIVRLLYLLVQNSELTAIQSIKERIRRECYSAIYEGIPESDPIHISKKCSVHYALLHLADPENHEIIISDTHRKQIIGVFGHIVESPSSDIERFIKQIRFKLYRSYGHYEEHDWKYRWFFYSRDLKSLWEGKNSKKAQESTSASFDVNAEEIASDLEGATVNSIGHRIQRSHKLVKQAKKRDQYTCRACGFHYDDQIVHVHHLDPISEYEHPQETKLSDLVTLCPTCHYMAHYWLRKSNKYKNIDNLLGLLEKESKSRALLS